LGERADSGTAAEFATTHWSDIRAVRTASLRRRRSVLDNLARRYWKPVYYYLRAKGYQDADARDITQDFFVEVVLGRDIFERADPHRGRFRAYLLHCLKNFLRDCRRREHTQRRSPNGLTISIDQWADLETPGELPLAPDEPPEQVFHHKWAASLLEEVLARLLAACEESGLKIHFELFRQRIVRPALEHVAPTPVDDLAHRYDLTAKQVSNRVETVRRRFRRLLLEEVRLTVMDEMTAEEELRALMAHLAPQAG
jgi:RNA polymerase sigma-70 factor (ECF subfamily)